MVNRTLFTPELEAAAHRCAVASSRCHRFSMSATDGVLDYAVVNDGATDTLLTLINGEWHEPTTFEGSVDDAD